MDAINELVLTNRIHCDCDSAWLVRHLMDRTTGDCLHLQYKIIPFEKIDVDTLEDC